MQTRLTEAIELAALPSKRPPAIYLEANGLMRGSENLSDYEKQQIRGIHQWLCGELGLINQGLEQLFEPVGKIVEAMIPPPLVEKIFQTLESVTAHWPHEWKTLQDKAGVENHQQLQQVSLEVCDHLAQDVQHKAIAQAAVTGGLSGLLGGIAVEVDIPLFLLLMWQTIYKIGLCYGYTPDTEEDKQFAWAIIELAIADTPKERKNTFKYWFKLHQILYPQIIEDLVEESAEAQTTKVISSQLIKQLITYQIESESGEGIPVLGCLFGASAEASLIKAVSRAAYRTFQTRWLIDHQKLKLCFEGNSI